MVDVGCGTPPVGETVMKPVLPYGGAGAGTPPGEPPGAGVGAEPPSDMGTAGTG